MRSYAVDPTDPNVSDPNSEIAILSVPNPQTNNNGGTLALGPDGYLYIWSGDGGGAGDPGGNGQDPSTLLGSILRIDVDTTSGANAYGIPSDNPFANGGETPEVFHYGLHNPVRFSIDAATGDLFDRGQDWQEEVDFVAGGGAGQNFGWNAFEGEFAVGPRRGPGLLQPLFVYEHDAGSRRRWRCRERRQRRVDGRLYLRRLASGRVWALHNDGDSASVVFSSEFAELQHVTQFFKDGAGNIYATTLDGSIVRLQISATPVNDAPTGSPTTVLPDGTEDVAYTVTAADLVAGFSDAEGDTLSVANLTASNGVVTYDAVSSTYTITPTADFNGAVTLTYDVTDGNGGSLSDQTHSYTITPSNDPPVLAGIEASPLEYTENDPATHYAGGFPVNLIPQAMVGLEGGGFVVIGDGMGQIFDATEQAVGGEFPVDLNSQAMVGLEGGGFVVIGDGMGEIFDDGTSRW